MPLFAVPNRISWRRLQRLLLFLFWGCVFPVLILMLFNRPTHYVFNVALPPEVPVHGVGPAEIGEKGVFRWFAARASLQLPALSATDHLLKLEIHGGGVAYRTLAIRVNNSPIAEVRLRPSWNTIVVLLPAAFLHRPVNELSFAIEALPPYNDEKFGFATTRLEIVQLAPDMMPVALFVWLIVIAIVIYIGLALLRLSLVERVAILSGVTVSLSYALAVARLPVAILLPGVALVSGLVVIVWGGMQLGAWRLQRSPSLWLRRLYLVAGFLFAIHVIGMNAPAFIDIDHRARANHVLLIAQGSGDAVQRLLSNQYEWGIATIPYSLLSYYPFVPLIVFFPDTYAMTFGLKIAVSFLDATTPLLLYLLLVRSGYRPRAGFLAGALFAGLPVTHLYFHDGSYPTILGVWWVVVTLVVVNEAVQRTRWSVLTSGLVSGVVLVALLIYVTHAAFVPLVIGVASLLAWRARAELAAAGPRLLAALGISIVLALALYYGQYVLPTLTALAARLAESDRLGHDRLPSPLVGSLWEQMWGHTRLVPLVLAPLGMAELLRRGWTWPACVMAGYLVLLGLGMIIDHQFSLWNKHWYFSLPALAILAGVALDRLAGYHTAGKVVAAALVGYLLVESTVAWLLRALLYQWSLQTL